MAANRVAAIDPLQVEMRNWRLFTGRVGNSCEFRRLFLEKPTDIHHNSGVSAGCANYDRFLWAFPRTVVGKIRMRPRIHKRMHPVKKSPITRARKNTINANILGGTVFGTNWNLPWDKRDPSLGQTGTCPWDKPACFC